jgi:predicted DNA repair protein MutK
VLAVNLLNALAGLVAGAVVLAAVQGIKRLRSR